jgi:hypothetical protein
LRRSGLEAASPEVRAGGWDRGSDESMVRFVIGSRNNARSHLERRDLPRPHVPWTEIIAIKAQSAESGRSAGRG